MNIQHVQPDQMVNGWKFQAGDHVTYKNQAAKIVRRLTEDEADLFDVGPMYEIDVGSVETIDVFEDELK